MAEQIRKQNIRLFQDSVKVCQNFENEGFANILRYLQITIVDVKSGSPTKVLMKDRFVQLCIAGWVAAFLILIYL